MKSISRLISGNNYYFFRFCAFSFLLRAKLVAQLFLLSPPFVLGIGKCLSVYSN